MNTPMQAIAATIDYLVDHYAENPSLEFLAKKAGYDPEYYQKIFKAHVGISPKRLCQYMSLRHAARFWRLANPRYWPPMKPGYPATPACMICSSPARASPPAKSKAGAKA
ncbi:MAG TPA: AraC family transcriptional regulator [Alphaproteobacteria bacterium]|nr:AraC family transcriptional regulator [Alphaproteobacteria bacterium]